MNQAWSKYLYETFVEARKSPGWNDLHKCHDEEDQDYFLMLEEEMEKGRLAPKEW